MNDTKKAEKAYGGPSAGNGNLTVYYFYPGGDVEIKVGGTAAWRNNNPGNLREFPDVRPDHNYTRNHGSIGRNKDNGFAIFPDWLTGLQAKKDLLLSPNYDDHTLYKAMEKYAPPQDGNNPLDYANEIARRATAVGEGQVTIDTPFRDITDSPARRKALYDYIDIRETARPGAIIRIDKDDFMFSAPEGWSPEERVQEGPGPEIPSQGWGDVFSRDGANYEAADNLAEALIPKISTSLASLSSGDGLDEAGATAWRNSVDRVRLVEKIKESIDESHENVVSAGNDPEQGLVSLVFENGKKISFDQKGNKTESIPDASNRSLLTPGASGDHQAGDIYDDEDEYARWSFSPGR